MATLAVAAVCSVGAVATAQTAQAYVPPGTGGMPLTPPMGFNSWYAYANTFNADNIAAQAKALVDNGLKADGYIDVGIDGGWWNHAADSSTPNRDTTTGRDATGAIVPNATFFTATYPTMNSLTTYIHGLGLKAGIYTDTASSGCGGEYGSDPGHVSQDMNQIAGWGFDYIKVDHCGGDAPGMNAQQTYTVFKNAIANSSNPLMTIELCEWGAESPWNWAPGVARSWRTNNDISGTYPEPGGQNSTGPLPRSQVFFSDVLRNWDANNWPGSAGPGSYNDPDYLLIGGFGLSQTQEQSYFGMWAIDAAPLVLASDITNMSQQTKNIVTNSEVIAVDQDPAAHQGVVVSNQNGLEVVSKRTSNSGERAVLLLNRSSSPSTITVNLADLGLAGTVSVRDLYAHQDLGTASGSYTSVTLPADGSVMLKLTGGSEISPTDNVAVQSSDGQAFVRLSYRSGSWTPTSWYGIGSPSVGFTGTPAVASANGLVNVFVRGTDNHVYQKTYTTSTGSWSDWTSLGGTVTAPPSATVNPITGAVSVFVNGADNAVWFKTSGNGVWPTNWTSIGGSIIGAPTAVYLSGGQVDVFAAGTDHTLWEKTYDGSTWSVNWTLVNSTVMGSSPSASLDASTGAITVAWRGAGTGTGDAVWAMTNTNGTWSTPVSLGGSVIGAPSVVSANGRTDVFGEGLDNAVWGTTNTGSGWSTNWWTLGGSSTSAPGAG